MSFNINASVVSYDDNFGYDIRGLKKTQNRSKKIIATDLKLKYNRDLYMNYMKNNNFSKNTINSYIYTLDKYFNEYKEITKDNLLLMKSKLIEENTAVKTINRTIITINSYIKCIFEETENADLLKLQLKCLKEQSKTFLENVITVQQFKQLCDFLKKNINKETEGKIIYNIDKNNKNKNGGILMIGNSKSSYQKIYIIVRCLGLTGVRVSELTKFNTQAVEDGYFDVCGKGGKVRRIYIPKKLQEELKEYIKDQNIQGFLFQNQKGQALTERYVAHALKDYAKMAGIPEKVVYPHSFRHMFAKAFLAKRQDIAFLADLLGHSSINTTRIYLRMTSEEQKALVDKIVDW